MATAPYQRDAATPVHQDGQEAPASVVRLRKNGGCVRGSRSRYHRSLSDSEIRRNSFDSSRANCAAGGNHLSNHSSSGSSDSRSSINYSCGSCYRTNRSEVNRSKRYCSVGSSISSYRRDWTISVLSEDTWTARQRTSRPTQEARHSLKQLPLFSAAVLHNKESPGCTAHAGSRVCDRRIPSIPAADVATGSDVSSPVCASPAVVAPSAVAANDGIDGGGGPTTERQTAAASVCVPLLVEDNMTATTRGTFAGCGAAVGSAGPTAAAGQGADGHEKTTPNAETEASQQEVASPRPAAAGGPPQSPAAPHEGGRTVATSPAGGRTPELYSCEQRGSVRSNNSVYLNFLSHGVTPPLLYEATSNVAEGATPATSVLHRFSQKQEQQRLSLTQSLRRRCGDAAAVLRRESASSGRGSTAGFLMQAQAPQQQHLLTHYGYHVQQQRQLTSEGFGVSELAREPQRPSVGQEEFYGAEGGRYEEGQAAQEWQQHHHHSGGQERSNRETAAAITSCEAKQGPSEIGRGTEAIARWKELTLRRDQLLDRYSDNTGNSGRDRPSDSDSSRSKSRGDTCDSRTRGGRHMLPPQHQFSLKGGNGMSPRSAAGATASPAAAATALLVERSRGYTVSKERQDEAGGRHVAHASAEGKQEERRGTYYEQPQSYGDVHVDVGPKREGQQAERDSTVFDRTAGLPSEYVSQLQNDETSRMPTSQQQSGLKKEHLQQQPETQHVLTSEGRRPRNRTGGVFCSFSLQTRSLRVSAGEEGTGGRACQGMQQRSVKRIVSEQYQVLPFERLADASGGGRDAAAAQTRDCLLHEQQGAEEGEDAVHEVEVRGPPLQAHVRAAAANARAAARRERRSLLHWCLRRRPTQVADDFYLEEFGGSDAVRAKVQVASAAEELPPPHTTLLLPLPEQRARRLRTHVVIEIRDGSHRILEVQVAEVLRMLEQQCEEDEQQQRLLRQERRQRRIGRQRAHLRRHRHSSSGTTGGSDDSSRCRSSAEDLTTGTQTSGSFFPVVSSRHWKERARSRRSQGVSKKCGNRTRILTRRHGSGSSSRSSLRDRLRYKLASARNMLVSSGDSARGRSSPVRAAACSASSDSSCSSCTPLRSAHAHRCVCSHPTAAHTPYRTRRRKGPSPLGGRTNDVHVGSSDKAALLAAPGSHGTTAKVLSCDVGKQDGQEGGDVLGHPQVQQDCCAPGEAEHAAKTELLLLRESIHKGLLQSTDAANVTLTSACTGHNHGGKREKPRCLVSPGGQCSGREECEGRVYNETGNEVFRRRSGRETGACCGGMISSSSSSQSSDTCGHNDTRRSSSAMVSGSSSSTQPNDMRHKNFARGSGRQRLSREKPPKETGVQRGFVAEREGDGFDGPSSCMRRRQYTCSSSCCLGCLHPCGTRPPPAAASRSCCGLCCRQCCCCSMCCCERCGGAVEEDPVRRVGKCRAIESRGKSRLSSSLSLASLSSLCAAVERQQLQLQLLQHQRQQRWQLQLQQAGARSKGKGGNDTGRLTYRDCRQAFTDVHPIPSIEVRRHVVLVCLPPITCFVLWDRVLLLMSEDLAPDRLICQLSKLTRQYAMFERKGRASAAGGGGWFSSQSYRQPGEAERKQQQQPCEKEERQQEDGTSVYPLQRPQGEMWLRQRGQHFPKGNSYVSSKEQRLLHEHGYHSPSLQLVASLEKQQLLRRSSHSAPEGLLEEVEEAAAAAREKAALYMEASGGGSFTFYDKHHSVDSLACSLAGPSHESDRPPSIRATSVGATEPEHQRHSYSVQMPDQSSPMAATACGGSSRYCCDGREAASEVKPDEQQRHRLLDAPDCSRSSVFEEATNLAAAPVPICETRLIGGIREEASKEVFSLTAVESRTGHLTEKCYHRYYRMDSEGAATRQEMPIQKAPDGTVKQEPRFETTPLCGSTLSAASASLPSAASPPRASPPTASSMHRPHLRQGKDAAAAAAGRPVYAQASLSPPPRGVAATDTTLRSRSEEAAALAGGQGGRSAADLLSSAQQLTAEHQHVLAEQSQSVRLLLTNAEKQQQDTGQQRADEVYVRKTSGEHVGGEENQRAKTETNVSVCSGSGGRTGRGHRTQQHDGSAKTWCNSSSHEEHVYTRAASFSETSSRGASRRAEKRRKGPPGGKRVMPFEFAALECIFFAAFQQLNLDIMYLEKKFAETHHRAAKKSEASSILLEGLHSLKEPVAVYEDRVTAFDKAFDELLSNSVDLHRMELTRLHYNPGLYDFDPHKDEVDPELEILLEYFDQEMDQFKDRVRHLKQGIDNTERLISLRLALMRNRLIQWELAAAVVAAGIAIGTCISGIFGMNLSNGYEDGKEHSHEMFTIVSALITVLAVGSVAVVLYLIRTIVL